MGVHRAVAARGRSQLEDLACGRVEDQAIAAGVGEIEHGVDRARPGVEGVRAQTPAVQPVNLDTSSTQVITYLDCILIGQSRISTFTCRSSLIYCTAVL